MDGAEAIVVEAMMEPIVLSTMTKFKEEEMVRFIIMSRNHDYRYRENHNSVKHVATLEAQKKL